MRLRPYETEPSHHAAGRDSDPRGLPVIECDPVVDVIADRLHQRLPLRQLTK